MSERCSLDCMAGSFPAITVVIDQHMVEDGDLVTSASISAGIDIALKVVSRFFGEQIGRATARHMEYPLPKRNERRI